MIPRRAADVFRAFAALVHSRVPDGHRIELRRENRVESAHRVVCGECGRGAAGPDDRCQSCGGIAFNVAQIDRERERYRSFIAAVDGPQQVDLFPATEPLRLVSKPRKTA